MARCIDKYVHVWIPDTNADKPVKPVSPNPMVPFTNPFEKASQLHLQEQSGRAQEPRIAQRLFPPPDGTRNYSGCGSKTTHITRLKDKLLVSSATTRLHDEEVEISNSATTTKANTAGENMVEEQTTNNNNDKDTDHSPTDESNKMPTLLKYYGLIRNYGFTNFLDSMMRRKSSDTGVNRNISDQIKQNEDKTESDTNNSTRDNKPQRSLENSSNNVELRLDSKKPERHSDSTEDRHLSMPSDQSNAHQAYKITDAFLSSNDQLSARTSYHPYSGRSKKVDSEFSLSTLRELQAPSSDKPVDESKDHVWRSPPLVERKVSARNLISRDSNELSSENQPKSVIDTLSNNHITTNDQPLEQQKAPKLTKKQRAARTRGNRAGLEDGEFPAWWPGSPVTPYTQQKQIAVTWTNDSEKKAFTSHKLVNIRKNAGGAPAAGHNWPTVTKSDREVDPPNPDNVPIYVKPVVRIYNYERISSALKRYVTHLKDAMFKAKQSHDQSLKEELRHSSALPHFPTASGESSLPPAWRTNSLPDDPSDPVERLRFAYFVYSRRLLQKIKEKKNPNLRVAKSYKNNPILHGV